VKPISEWRDDQLSCYSDVLRALEEPDLAAEDRVVTRKAGVTYYSPCPSCTMEARWTDEIVSIIGPLGLRDTVQTNVHCLTCGSAA
jgi:hypothetical protein